MPIELKRTVLHVYEDGSEGLIKIETMNEDTIIISQGPNTVMINDQSHLEDIIKNLRSVAKEIWSD